MKILVLGDICLDINHFGKVERISPEAPVPVFKYDHSEYKLGMTGNVALALKKLGHDVTIFSTSQEPKMKELLEYNDLNIKYTLENYRTIRKERFFVDKHYLFRMDKEIIEELHDWDKEYIVKDIEDNNYDAIVLQDYAKGFFDSGLINEINTESLLIADGNALRDSTFYEVVDYLKVNEKEDNAIDFLVRNKIITKGNKATIFYSTYQESGIFIPVPKVNVIDVTGAGDVFTAWFTDGRLKNMELKDNIERANKAASYSCTKLGCYSPTEQEVKEFYEEVK